MDFQFTVDEGIAAISKIKNGADVQASMKSTVPQGKNEEMALLGYLFIWKTIKNFQESYYYWSAVD